MEHLRCAGTLILTGCAGLLEQSPSNHAAQSLVEETELSQVSSSVYGLGVDTVNGTWNHRKR